MSYLNILRNIGSKAGSGAAKAAKTGVKAGLAGVAFVTGAALKKGAVWTSKQIMFNVGDEVLTVVKIVNAVCPPAREYIRATLAKGYYKSPLMKEYFDKHVAEHWQTGWKFVGKHAKDRNFASQAESFARENVRADAVKVFKKLDNTMSKMSVGDAMSMAFMAYAFADFVVVYFKNSASAVAKMAAVVNCLATTSLTTLQNKSIAYDAFMKMAKDEQGLDALDAFLCLSYLASLGENAKEISIRIRDIFDIELPKEITLLIATNVIDLVHSTAYIEDATDLNFTEDKLVQFSVALKKALNDEDVESFEDVLINTSIDGTIILDYVGEELARHSSIKNSTDIGVPMSVKPRQHKDPNYDHTSSPNRDEAETENYTNGAVMAAQGSQTATIPDIGLSEARSLRLEVQKIARTICGSEGDVINFLQALRKLEKVDTKLLEVVCYQQF